MNQVTTNILFYIFEFIDEIKRFKKCISVCKKWNTMILKSHLSWKNSFTINEYTIRYFNLLRFYNSISHIQTLYIKDMKYIPDCPRLFKHLHTLIIKDDSLYHPILLPKMSSFERNNHNIDQIYYINKNINNKAKIIRQQNQSTTYFDSTLIFTSTQYKTIQILQTGEIINLYLTGNKIIKNKYNINTLKPIMSSLSSNELLYKQVKKLQIPFNLYLFQEGTLSHIQILNIVYTVYSSLGIRRNRDRISNDKLKLESVTFLQFLHSPTNYSSSIQFEVMSDLIPKQIETLFISYPIQHSFTSKFHRILKFDRARDGFNFKKSLTQLQTFYTNFYFDCKLSLPESITNVCIPYLSLSYVAKPKNKTFKHFWLIVSRTMEYIRPRKIVKFNLSSDHSVINGYIINDNALEYCEFSGDAPFQMIEIVNFSSDCVRYLKNITCIKHLVIASIELSEYKLKGDVDRCIELKKINGSCDERQRLQIPKEQHKIKVDKLTIPYGYEYIKYYFNYQELELISMTHYNYFERLYGFESQKTNTNYINTVKEKLFLLLKDMDIVNKVCLPYI